MIQHDERPLTPLDVIYARRSVRSYTKHKLDAATIRGLLDAAVQAPTAMHSEPWAFVVIQDEKMLERYSDTAKTAWAEELLKFRDLHMRHPLIHGDFAQQLAAPEFNVFYDAGTLIVICGKAMGPFVTADCWLAAQNLMLAACALGLGTCCIGSAVLALNTPEAKAELGLPPGTTAIAPIIVGVPANGTAPVSRRDPDILYWK